MFSLNAGILPEPYVDADAVANHLHVRRRQVLQLTRAGKLPAHPLDPTAKRKLWRYRMSEVDDVISLAYNHVRPHNGDGSPRSRKEKN